MWYVPSNTNMMYYFYRDDLLQEAGLKPAETLDEYLMLAEKLTTPQRFGTLMTLKRVDALRNDFHSWLMANGGAWFDKDLKPVFNSPEGVAALTYMKELFKFAPPGVLSYANDEWSLGDPSVFNGQAMGGTWTLTVTDSTKDGITGTLESWSLTVTMVPAGMSAAAAALVPSETQVASEPTSTASTTT